MSPDKRENPSRIDPVYHEMVEQRSIQNMKSELEGKPYEYVSSEQKRQEEVQAITAHNLIREFREKYIPTREERAVMREAEKEIALISPHLLEKDE